MYKLSDFEKSSKHLYKLGKFISICICIIIVFFLIFNVSLIITSYIKPGETPNFFGIKSFTIVSESMEPKINKQDVIFIKEVDKDELEVGDIISFKTGEIINTHRIVKIEEQNGEEVYITKGDNNKKEDRGYVKLNDIEGKYLFKIPRFGIIVEILKSKITLVILLVILVLISYYQVVLTKRKLKRKEERYEYNKNLLKENQKKINKIRGWYILYKAIFIDIDGTLRNDDREITYKTKEAIKNVREKGILVILCSGRPIKTTKEISKESCASNYIITSNGAYGYDYIENKCVFKNPMRREDCLEIYKIAKENDVNFIMNTEMGRVVLKKTSNNNISFILNLIPFFSK